MSLICCYCGCASEGVYWIDSPLDGEPDEELCNNCVLGNEPSIAEIHRKLAAEEPILRELRLRHNAAEVALWKESNPKWFEVWKCRHIVPATVGPSTTP